MSESLPNNVNPSQRSPETDALMKRFVEDRSSLEPDELDCLIDALRAQPALAVEVHTQLLLDDLLAQKLAIDRRDFLAQVGQRIGDFEQGEEEIFSQVSELRALAEAELVERAAPKPSRWSLLLIATLAASLAVVAFLLPQYWPVSPRAVAKVSAVSGPVSMLQNGKQVSLQVGDTISTGTPFEVPSGARLTLDYVDKTSVQFGSDSNATKFELVAERKSRAKLVSLQQGEALASVMPQRDLGPMVFRTPQARAIVLGTEFRLIVSPQATRLDVTKGKVDFVRSQGDKKSLVAANQSAVADERGLVLRNQQWPDDSDSLVFMLRGPENIPLLRNPSSGNLRETPFEVRGLANFVQGVNVYNLCGGSLISAEGGDDLVANIQDSGAFTIEAIVMPDSYRAQDARIFALGDKGDQACFRLLQRGSELVFQLWTDGARTPHELNLGSVKADQATQVAITWQPTALTGYVNGVQKASIDNLKGGLATWAPGAFSVGADADGQNVWRGTLCDLAITGLSKDSGQVKQSRGVYEMLYARRDAGLSWDNLMSDDLDPTRFAGAGNWQVVNDSWTNEPAEDAWFGLGPDGMTNYDLLVDVHWEEGDGPLKLTLPVDQRCGVAILPRSGGEQKTTLQDMGGGPMPGNNSVSSDRSLPVGRTARLEVQVRLHKDTASLAVQVDGQPWLKWEGDPSELRDVTATNNVPTLKRPVLIAADNIVRIEALKVRDLSRIASSAIGQ